MEHRIVLTKQDLLVASVACGWAAHLLCGCEKCVAAVAEMLQAGRSIPGTLEDMLRARDLLQSGTKSISVEQFKDPIEIIIQQPDEG